MQGTNSQLIIFLIVMGFSVLSWIIGYLKEQSRIKKAKDEQRRRFEESLRTGRPPEQATSAPDPAAELAARRQAQLQELRRQQMKDRGQQAPGTAVALPVPTSTPRGAKQPGLPVPPRQPRGPVVIQRAPASPPPRAKDPRQQPLDMKVRQQAPSSSPTVTNDPRGYTAIRQKEQLERERDTQIAERNEAIEVERRSQIAQSARRDEALAAASSLAAAKASARVGARALLFDSSSGVPSRAALKRAVLLAEVFARPVGDRPD